MAVEGRGRREDAQNRFQKHELERKVDREVRPKERLEMEVCYMQDGKRGRC